MDYHKPVMLQEAIEALNVMKNGRYIDCTLGDGGHSLEILKRGGSVLGLDVDDSAIFRADQRIKEAGLSDNYRAVQANFRDIDRVARENGFTEVDGILYDLGYSSYQLGVEEKGISFMADQELDMRLDKNLGVTAADLLNALSERELASIFFNYSDERLSRRYAKAIVQARNLKKFRTTKDLADLIVSVAPPDYERGRIHPATRVFQALRIAVNNEVDNLSVSLPRAALLLRPPKSGGEDKPLLPGGRMVVISFHSLEDKLVKDFGRKVRPDLIQITEKPLVPSDLEVSDNIRSRSAKMRVFEKA